MASYLYSLVDKEVCIITGDGSNICGVLKGCDRATNVILSNAHERKYFESKWIAYDAPRHLYHFSPQSMKSILSNYGFKISTYKALYQDTLFNIVGSYSDLKFYNIFHAGYCAFMSLLLSIFDKNKSSSIIYICKRN